MGSVGAKKSSGGGVLTGQQVVQEPGQPIVAPANTTPDQDVNVNFSDVDGTGFKELYNGRQYYNNQVFDIDARQAIADYLLADALPGSLYSPSQDLNYRMEHGLPLDGNQEFMVGAMNDAMHNLGYDLALTRYGRVDYIDKFGQLAGVNINSNNYGNMSIQQLKKAFVGLEYGEDAFVSTSYNGFKNAPNGGKPFTDKAVRLSINAPAKTQALMPGNGPGGALGEIILKPGQRYRITDVVFRTGNGRSGGGSYKNIEFKVEVITD